MKRFLVRALIFFAGVVSVCAQGGISSEFYWESPERITQTDARFPRSVTDGNTSYIFWQDIDARAQRLWLSVYYEDEDGTWKTNSRFAGPFSYSGEVPDVYSVACSSTGTLAAAVLTDTYRITIFVSNDGGHSFQAVELPEQEEPPVAPRIYAARNGGFRLFSSLGQNERFSLYTASSANGISWSTFKIFEPSNGMPNPFVPVLVTAHDADIVVFQAHYQSENRLSYQLYATRSTNNGASWTAPVLLTDETSLVAGDTRTFASYNNQQPYLALFDGELYLAWERSYYASENSAIAVARLSHTGIVPGSVEMLSERGIANRAVVFTYQGTLSVVWFDTRTGVETVYMAQKHGSLWETARLSNGRRAALFGAPLLLNGGATLSFVWQENAPSLSTIYWLRPDTSVLPPTIRALSFTEGRRAAAERVRLRVQLPGDSSGIAGFSWVWTQDESAVPLEELMNLPQDTTMSLDASAEGAWYFRARALDYAGNWSSPVTIVYYRDLSPPHAPVLMPLQTDRFGFLLSNTFSVSWQPDEADDDVAGYTWNLEYIAPLDGRITETARHPIALSDEAVSAVLAELHAAHADAGAHVERPPARILSTARSVSYENRRNGLYVFSVAAVDTVGNIGQATTTVLVLNKYAPVTFIATVGKEVNLFGDVTLSVTGGGFTYDGTVSTVYIDSDGTAPYDMTLTRDAGQFRVLSDNRIVDIRLGRDIPRGTYRIGLVHPDRGLYMSAPLFSIEESGTVKLEQQYRYVPSWTIHSEQRRWQIEAGVVLLWAVCALAVIGMVAAMRGIVQTTRDAYAARTEVQALITGVAMLQDKKQKAVALKQRGGSLKFKLVGFTTLLVVMIVVLVSVPLGYNMTQTQERTLSESLEQRVQVLLESLASGVRAYMPTQNVLELSYLPNQSSALVESEFVTITGFSSDGRNTGLTYVWASNDTAIAEKVDTAELSLGRSAVTDDTVIAIAGRMAELNAAAVSIGGDIAANIAELNAEGVRLAVNTDARSVARREEIAEITTQLTDRFNTAMAELSVNGSGSYPQFNSGKLDRSTTEYLFYRPVIYRQGASQEYVRGIIFIQVSTETLIGDVSAARNSIILVAVIIALVAVAIGALGSFFLATLIIRPIRQLAAHVAQIGQTRNKEKLAGKDIIIKSRDEIGRLGETVNEMTRGLVKAALDEKLLMDGKIVQQTFLPLESGAHGKETIAALRETTIECFGYYEGASGVSGDYFDYKKLDDRWYVIIKCDASGHGVPAALIMTIVATLFRKYFESWTYAQNGTRINELVMQINDFIESLGLKGKFATIIVCLFDSTNGDTYLCNAGDNIVHIYDGAKHMQRVLTLPETPAAGPLPSFMVDMRGGFKVEKINIRRGDVLFLYTDGIEEATRRFRDQYFAVMKCAEPGLADGAQHGNHKVGEESEQLEAERVQNIIEAVFNRREYMLEKAHNPEPDEMLRFDFSTCAGTIEEAIIALASVEKVFRLYKAPDVTPFDTVRVDKRIDAFLRAHFNRYDYYCSAQNELPNEQNYVEYTNVREDEQLDDLTLLAVRRV